MNKAIVFYCKDCNEMFFAAMEDPVVLEDCANEVAEYLAAGHRLEKVGRDIVVDEFEGCKCNEEPDNEQGRLL